MFPFDEKVLKIKKRFWENNIDVGNTEKPQNMKITKKKEKSGEDGIIIIIRCYNLEAIIRVIGVSVTLHA